MSPSRRGYLFLAAILAVSVAGCEPRADRIAQPRATSDLVRDYVAIGDGFTSGAQSGALSKRHQDDSYPAVLAALFGVSREATSAMTQPLISNPGYPITRPIVPGGYFTIVDYEPVTLARAAWSDSSLLFDRCAMHGQMEINRTQSFPFRNLSAPGLLAHDVRFAIDSLTTWSATVPAEPEPNYFVECVLRLGDLCDGAADTTTILDQAISRTPKLTTLWLGMSEMLVAATTGSPPYDAATFGAHVGAILDSLADVGSAVVVGTIPDVTALPFCELPGASCEDIASVLVGYNAELRRVAAEHEAAISDMHALFETFSRGVSFGGVTFDTSYLTGGLISLDGLHPTSLGYALIAQHFVETINAALDAGVPDVNLGPYLEP